jgi:hypothetical protein
MYNAFKKGLATFIMVIPVITALSFHIKPVMSNNVQVSKYRQTHDDLSKFQGYYQLSEDSDMYIQILIKQDKLVLKQMWDKEEITFDQTSDLEFYNSQHNFPLKFVTANGAITEVIAFSRDVWKKVASYMPVVNKEVQLGEKKLKSFEGFYNLSTNQKAYLRMTAKGNNIVVKEMWSGKEIVIAPASDLEFFGKDMRYPVKFTKDDKGAVTEALIFERDKWLKVDDQQTQFLEK